MLTVPKVPWPRTRFISYLLLKSLLKLPGKQRRGEGLEGEESAERWGLGTKEKGRGEGKAGRLKAGRGGWTTVQRKLQGVGEGAGPKEVEG